MIQYFLIILCAISGMSVVFSHNNTCKNLEKTEFDLKLYIHNSSLSKNLNCYQFLTFVFSYIVERKNCLPDRFECDNGKCVFQDMVHDGKNDCGDNSDEGKEIFYENITYIL